MPNTIVIGKNEYEFLSTNIQPVSTDIFNIVQQVNHYRNFLLEVVSFSTGGYPNPACII